MATERVDELNLTGIRVQALAGEAHPGGDPVSAEEQPVDDQGLQRRAECTDRA